MMLKNTSNQRGANSVTICSLAHEITAADAGRFESCLLGNYLAVSTWILDGSSIECDEKKRQRFSLSGVRFGSGAIQNSGAVENELSTLDSFLQRVV